jgi:hypothetical protein
MARKFFIKLSNAKFHTHTRRDSRPFRTWAKVRADSGSDDTKRIVLTAHRREHFFKTVLKSVAICWDAENNGTTQCS